MKVKGSAVYGKQETGSVRSFVTGLSLSFFLWGQFAAAGAALADAPSRPADQASAKTWPINPFARTAPDAGAKAAVAAPAPAAPAAHAGANGHDAASVAAAGPAATLKALDVTLRDMHEALSRQRDVIIKKRGKDGSLHITILGTHQDVDLSGDRARLSAIGRRLDEQDREALADFQHDQEQISSHHLPPLMQQRHDEAVARFERGRAERQQALDTLQHSQDLDALLARSASLLGQGAAAQPQYAGFDPQHTPFRIPAASVRAPRTTPAELQNLLTPQLQQSALPLPVAARRQEIPAAQLALIAQAARQGERYLAPPAPLEVASADFIGGLLGIAQAGSGASSYLGTSDEIQFTPAIQALAAQLNNNPVAIFNWVHDNIDYVPSYGSIQGADLTLQSRHGNSFDINSLLIALLRAAQIPARYVYGSIQVPVAQAQNWFGGVASPDAAQALLSQGGVPNSALTQGGVTAAIQLEHVWVEAYVANDPSRGVKSLGGFGWVPLDASFKHYNDVAGMGLAQGVNSGAYGLDSALSNSANVNAQTGAISGLNSAAIQSALSSYQSQVNQFISAHDANATVGEVLGTRSIVPSAADVLPSGLPYHVLSAGAPLDALPDNLRFKFQMSLYTAPADTSQPGLVSYASSLPALGAGRLTLSFTPATADDETALQSYFPQPHADGSPIAASEYPSTIPGYLIHVLPQILLNGQAVSTAPASGAVELGTAMSLYTGLLDPSSGAWDNAPAAGVVAGEYEALAVDGAGIGATQLNTVAQRLAATQAALLAKQYSSLTLDQVSGDLLYNTALGYFALGDAYASLYERASGVAAARLPSYARAVVETTAQFQNGVPVKVSFPGVALRVDRYTGSAVAVSDSTGASGAPSAAVDYQRQSLDRGSAYAHLILEQLFGAAAQNMPGASAIRALTQSISNAQTIYLLNQGNVSTSLPLVQQLPAQTTTDIQNAVAAGLQAIVSQTGVTLGVWQGSGYILSDPQTGAGAYLVTGGDTGLLYSPQGMPWLALANPNQLPGDAMGSIFGAVQPFDAAQAGLLGGVDSLRWSDLPDSSELIAGIYGSSFDFLGGVAAPLLWATDTQIVEQGTSQPSSLAQGNKPPVFTSSPVTKANEGTVYRYQASAADPAGNPISFSVTQSPGGVSISSTGLVSWAQPVQGTWSISLKADDGKSSATQSYSLQVGPAPTPLTATLSVAPVPASPGAPVSISFVTGGGSGTVHSSLIVNGQAVSLPASGQVQVAAPGVPGVYTVTATASDAVTSLTRSAQISVADSSDTTAPIAQITAPAQDTQVTSAVAVTGSATDNETVANYQLMLRPSGSGNGAWVQFGGGTQAVSNGTLGTFDPSTLANGPYDIGLFVTDQSGNTASQVVGVQVQGNLKVGQFSISFLDLNVQASGVPIRVTRTYSTQNKGTSGDFGYGWTVDDQSLQLRTNMVIGLNWQVTQQGFNLCLDPGGNRIVTITLPDGSLQRFTAQNSPDCATAQIPLNIVFNPLPGTTSSLNVVNMPNLQAQGGQLYDEDGNIWNPSQFQLTTADGYIYSLTADVGITSVQDPFGNVLSYNAAGITHSDGQGVPFTRDAQGRITTVTDPAGKQLTYTYDGNGNLATVTDRAGQVSKFSYDANHDLISYTDPRGVTVTQNFYNANGQLVEVVDANGQVTQINNQASANQQTVTDPRGNSTTYTYDNSGNIVAKLDALGNTTTYTYDALGNQTSQTDPLGHTSKATFDPSSSKQLTATDALGHTTSWSYNRNFTLAQTQDANGNQTSYGYFNGGTVPYSITQPLGSQAVTKIDLNSGNLYELDVPGATLKYGYDIQGHQTSATDALGHTTSYSYDANGNQTGSSWTRTTAAGAVHTATIATAYDTLGNPTQRIDALGYVIKTQYNGARKPTQQTDARNIVTQYQYDPTARLIETDYADGTSDKNAYDENGNVVQTIDRAGRVTSTQYDALNRAVQVTNPDGSSTATAYDAIGNVTSETDARGNTTTHAYDAARRVTSDTDALGRITQYGYDANGNKTSITGPDGRTTTYTYDALNRLASTQYPDGSTSSQTYDTFGRKLSQTDQNGTVTSYGYDAKGELTSVTQTLNGNSLVTQYAYDEVGNKISQTDAQGRVTSWGYDDAGHVTSRTLPSGETESFVYDGNSNLTSHTDFNGQTTRYAFDSSNRVIAKILPNARQVTTTYFPSGQIATVSDQNGTTSYQYDAQDRLTLMQSPSGNLAYAYDANGNRVQLTSPQGTTSYQYDEINRLVAVTGPDGKQTRYGYDAAGNRASVSYPNNVTTTYAYDSDNRLTQITHTRTSDNMVLASYQYMLDTAGQRTQVTESQAGTVTRQLNYTYDGLYRLTQEQLQVPVSGALTTTRTTSWTYDNTGNRLTQTVTIPALGSAPGSTTVSSYTYDSDDRLLTEIASINGAQTQSITYAYDSNGNTISKSVTVGSSTNVALFTYDSDNELVQVSQGSSVQTATPVAGFVYDQDGNRVQANGSESIAYLVDSNQAYAQVIEESETGAQGSGSTLYVRSDDDLISQSRNASQSYFHGDGLGSTRLLTGTTGQVSDSYSYQAFGATDAQSGVTINRHLYAGEYQDPNIGLYNLRARWMNPLVGRFITRDTFQGDRFEPASLHQYTYAGNNPLNHIDPSGRDFDLGGIGAAAGVGATLGAIGTATYDYAIGKAITIGDVAQGALIGAAIAGVAAVSTVVAVGAAVVGTYQSGALVFRVFDDPGSTIGQRVAASALLLAAVAGPAFASDYAGRFYNKPLSINDYRVLHDLGVDDVAAFFKANGFTVAKEVYVRNPFYKVGRRYDLVVRDANGRYLAIEYKGTQGAIDNQSTQQVNADGYINQQGGVMFGSSAKGAGFFGGVVDRVILLGPDTSARQ